MYIKHLTWTIARPECGECTREGTAIKLPVCTSKRYKLSCAPIRAVWSESLIDALWIANGPTFVHAEKLRHWSDCVDAQTDLNLHCTNIPTCNFCWIPAQVCNSKRKSAQAEACQHAQLQRLCWICNSYNRYSYCTVETASNYGVDQAAQKHRLIGALVMFAFD